MHSNPHCSDMLGSLKPLSHGSKQVRPPDIGTHTRVLGGSGLRAHGCSTCLHSIGEACMTAQQGRTRARAGHAEQHTLPPAESGRAGHGGAERAPARPPGRVRRARAGVQLRGARRPGTACVPQSQRTNRTTFPTSVPAPEPTTCWCLHQHAPCHCWRLHQRAAVRARRSDRCSTRAARAAAAAGSPRRRAAGAHGRAAQGAGARPAHQPALAGRLPPLPARRALLHLLRPPARGRPRSALPCAHARRLQAAADGRSLAVPAQRLCCSRSARCFGAPPQL